MNSDARQPAMVILGPTGSGKTPLGDMLQHKGLGGRRCIHFDFGENLRQVVTRNRPDQVVSARDIDFLRHILKSGALLEDKDFPIAQRLLTSYRQRHAATPDTLLVMNGLPRHVGQATALHEELDVCRVVVLECTAAAVLERIGSNIGGDRTRRTDDDRAAIERKLRLFADRTAPLVDYYRQPNISIHSIQVTADMTANQMWQALQPR